MDEPGVARYGDRMIRTVAALCFALTLLCPIFCLAAEDGACADHDREAGRNCEAISVGAVVAEVTPAPATWVCLPPALDRLVLTQPQLAGSRVPARISTWNRSSAKPPPGATRQSLLQTFLF